MISFDIIEQMVSAESNRLVYFPTIKAGIEHVYKCQEPFIWISGIIPTAELDLKVMLKGIQLEHLKGMVLLSHYNDDIIDGARQIAKLSGQLNVAGITLPASADSVKEIILQVLGNCERLNPVIKKQNMDDIPDLWEAVESGGLVPFYQAKYSLATSEITGFEILSRINYQGIHYTPDRFIHKLLSGADLNKFTYIVLEKALEEFSENCEFNGSLSLNVDYKSLDNEDFAENIVKILDKYNFSPERMIIEITEDNPVVDIHVIRSLTFFRMRGCNVSIDDFGMKHTGFSELFRLPFSEIKIDKSFTQDMLASPRSLKVVKALCAVAQSLGYTTVAEGVETAEQEQKLRELNIDLVQGYLYSKPLPIGETRLLLESEQSNIQQMKKRKSAGG
ncbi:EAL domain-containing protein [Vibrio sp. JC009]|uniref:EAL domain-containing protein n=1 Tax=Vibrio sp. JC009 TaxID=2912314 RepID=UPI0023B19ADB|nr:EAL domain-containing protein [Vibrio sp. JC009]WED24506.1 EAL domain-containing protein [Vibrio sp. JC009]